MDSPFGAAIAKALQLPPEQHVDLWVEENIYLAGDAELKGAVSFDLLPMVRFFLRACQRAGVRTVVLICSAQSAKTQSVQFYLIWKIKNSPGPTIWYIDTSESARLFSQTRLWNDLHGCDLIAEELPKNRHMKKWSLMQLTSMNLYVLGANAKRNRERISAETVLCDERRNYPKGAMASIRNRYKTFRNSKEISFTTAGAQFDEVHQAFLFGSQTFFHWACLSCGHRQPFRFGRGKTTMFPTERACGGVIWEDNRLTHPSEHVWNIAEVRKTVRYECENPACKRHYYTHEKPALLATMTEENNWGAVQTNLLASPENISVYWNELYMPWPDASFESVATKFLQAQVSLKRAHNNEPMKVFVTETLGEPWKEETKTFEPSAVLKCRGDYALGEAWLERDAKILTVDVQRGHLIYVIRQWKAGGASRLLNCGRILDFEELEKLREREGIPSEVTWIDSAHDTQKVYEACLRYGWIALLGDDARDFHRLEYDEREKKNVPIRSYWKSVDIDPSVGKKSGTITIRRFSWCNDHYKTMLYQDFIPQRDGRTWLLPRNISPEYVEQLSCTELQEITESDGSITRKWIELDRHDFADGELMQLVVADQGGIFQ